MKETALEVDLWREFFYFHYLCGDKVAVGISLENLLIET